MAVDVFRRQMLSDCKCYRTCVRWQWMFSGDRWELAADVKEFVVNDCGCFQDTDVMWLQVLQDMC